MTEKSLGFTIPEKGFMNQGKEAAGSRINASIGVALSDDQEPMVLSSLSSQFHVENNALLYSGCYGEKDLRPLWAKDILRKNPGLEGHRFSNPLVTAGLTQGLNLAGQLFVSPRDTLILSDPVYENYKHIFGNFFQADLSTFPLHQQGRFNLEGLNRSIEEAGDQVRILLNFPNNPLGYSLLLEEAEALKQSLYSFCEKGKKILLMLDDAYFGLFYEKDLLKESLFSFLADLHSNLLIMKIDGSSKEFFAWGLRIGFVSFQSKDFQEKDYRELEDRAAAVIRATVSNVSRLSQTMMIKVLTDKATLPEKQVQDALLTERYQLVRQILKNHPEYKDQFVAEPFNSGYFFCIRLREGVNSHQLRKILRNKDIGLIAPTEEHIRVAFSSLNHNQLPELFERIYYCCQNYEKLLTEI